MGLIQLVLKTKQQRTVALNKARRIILALGKRSIDNSGVFENELCSYNSINTPASFVQPSFILTPTAIKESKLYAALPANGNGDLTWTRATTATRVNSAGLIESVASNIPRINYPIGGGCPSILLEPARTNLFSYSEQFDNAAWIKTRATVTVNDTIAPDGISTADKLVGTSTAGTNYVYRDINMISGTAYIMSICVKPITQSAIIINSFAQSGTARFSLVGAGSIISVSGVCSDAKIISLTGGWFLVSVKITANATALNPVGYLTDNAGFIGDLFHIWGADLQLGSYPTSYIPTTTAAVTRNADTFTRNNIYTNGLISASGGSWYVELDNNIVMTRDAAGAGLYISSINNPSMGNGNAGDVISFLRTSTVGNRLQIIKQTGLVFTSLYTTLTDTVKVLIKWNGTTCDVFVNGVKVVAASAFTATILEHLNNNNTDIPKYIKKMALYSTPISDAQAIIETTL